MSEQKKPAPSSGTHYRGKAIVLRTYSKGLFLYPLAIFSFIAAIIEYIQQSTYPGQAPMAALAVIWMAILFINLFVMSFDISAGKFIALLLAFVGIVIIIILVIILSPNYSFQFPSGQNIQDYFDLGLRAQFYLGVSYISGGIVLMVIIKARFQYVRIEQNEVYVKGILGDAKRLPITSLKVEKQITDFFEYLALRAGSITLFVSGEPPIRLETVLMVNKREKEIDLLLSAIRTKATS
jgi:hypothetical protein